jgi:lipopolysaccharide transport system permease protein
LGIGESKSVAFNPETRGLGTLPDPQSDRPAPVPRLVIEPQAGWSFDFRELWSYRSLFSFLVYREIKVRYAQTVLGAGWAILQPLLTMAVFTVIFGNFADMPSDDVPYPLFSLSALVLWTYFATALSNSSSSLVASANLLSKIYFPRLVIPFSPILAGLVDFAIASALLAVVMAWYGVLPELSAFIAGPIAIGIAVLTAGGVGCWLSALNLRYRDIKYVVPFLIQVWMYASPIVYPLSMIPERYRTVYALNPMAGAIEGFRASLTGSQPVPWLLMMISGGVAMVIFLSGILYFRSTEQAFADVV